MRGELSGADLSRLDLSRVNLNGVICSRVYENRYVSAQFNQSLLHAVNIFPQGHSQHVNSTEYSGDGKKILSASLDGTIKKWDAQSGKCLKSYKGDQSSLPAAQNNRQGDNILEWGGGTIRIKNASTGEVLQTLINIPGLWIQGCSFAQLLPNSRLSAKELERLRIYGATAAEKNVLTAEGGEGQPGDMEPV